MRLTHEDILSFMRDSLETDVSEVTGSTELFETGVLDSFAIISVVSFLEDSGGFKFTMEDINLENLGTIDRMVAYVSQRSQGEH